MTTVSDAFRFARKHALSHMASCERAELRWGETAITEIVIANAARAVSVVPFTQSAEAVSGADWVWWWVDSAGAYGMLVQAKRVDVERRTWRFGFEYRSAHASYAQRDVLLSTADALSLLPVYALYLGTGGYRDWARCSDDHEEGRCLECVRRSVSLMPALLADASLVTDATSTYERSVALETIWTPPRTGSRLIPSLATQLTPHLREFLQTDQRGTRAVARAMIDRVLLIREGMHRLAAPNAASVSDGAHDALGSVFDEFPDDTIHGGVRYFPRTLNPLRAAPPEYVLEIMSGAIDADELAGSMPDDVAGVVVVQLDSGE